MASCLILQCFQKPIETIRVLESVAECDGVAEYDIILWCDVAHDSHLPNPGPLGQKNRELIEVLRKYQKSEEARFKSIELKINSQPRGPYTTCYDAIEYGFQGHAFVVFSEDDIAFAKDSLNYYSAYRDGRMPLGEGCIGVTADSQQFFPRSDVYSSKSIAISVGDKWKDEVNIMRKRAREHELYNKVLRAGWAPNKQMGMFKPGWDRIKHLRADGGTAEKAPDTLTGEFVRDNSLHFLYSVIPRCNDIGLFNEQGCTTLYYNATPNLSTIHYLTSDNFEENCEEYELLPGVPFNTVIG